MIPPLSVPGRRSGPVGALLVLLAVGLLALLGPLVAVVPAQADETPGATDDATADGETAATPLDVHLVRLSPATVPAKGTLVLAGTVTNTTEQTWSAVNVHAFLSTTPMTTRDELAAAAKSDPEQEVGTRLVDPGQFVAVGDLAPGATTAFRIALKVSELGLSAEGVYWIGVHALGQDPDGGERATLGRARTFIPLVRGTARTTSVAVVVPVRERVRRDSEGRVLSTTGWSEALEPNGRLGRLAAFLASAGTRPATLLVDPAVLEAVDDLKNDNPPLSLGPDEENPDAEPTEEPTEGASRSFNRLEPADRANAASWLDQVVAAARQHTTLGLGYADPDASALARRRPQMLALASRLSAQTFGDLDIPAVPTVAPTDGWFDEDLFSRIAEESMVLVSDHGAPRTRTRWRTAEHQDLVLTDEQVSSGGPGPTAPTDALALRQRVIADAALRRPSGSPAPLVVQLPDDWDPGPSWQLADFFNALDQPWLDLVALTPTTDLTTPTFTASLGYPASARRAEIPAVNVGAARTLIQTTTVTTKLLRSKNTIAHDLAGTAFNAVSYHARQDELLARQQVLASNVAMRSTLSKVAVIGTDFVTLSGGSGTLAVTLVNGLDQPVVVGVEPESSDPDVRIDTVEPVRLAPGERTVLRLDASSSGIGVAQVVLSPVTAGGKPLGTPLSFRLRTSQVGTLIWGVLGAAGLLLVVMIVRRVRRGLREHRWRRA